MEITQPIDDQAFNIGDNVQFLGIAPAGTRSVTLTADPNIPLGSATLSDPSASGEVKWAFSRRFQGAGHRVIEVTSADEGGTVLDQASVTISVNVTGVGDYVPPRASLGPLNDIVRLLEDERTERITRPFVGERAIFKFPQHDNVVYIESKLDLDTDGSSHSEGPDHQDDTSLHQVDGNAIDSNAVPYFVLPEPGTHTGAPGGQFFKEDLGITWGDIAAIIYHDRVCFALFADGGPQRKLGEASLQTHRELGFERLRKNGTVIDSGIDSGVITLIFPGSGTEFTNVAGRHLTLDIDAVMARVAEKGRELFVGLGGQLPA